MRWTVQSSLASRSARPVLKPAGLLGVFSFVFLSLSAVGLSAVPPVLSSKEFMHPLEGPVHISGSFGEYRKFGRYHHGLDYKTFNRNGWTVRTPLAGVVERVHVSTRGYGNGLFLRSPAGVRTTYGHLHDFRCPGARPGPAQDLEYLRRSLALLSPNRRVFLKIPPWFRFAAGECIARSGESGSGAPHLHFEVEYGGRFVDPLALNGLGIPDISAPMMLALYVEDRRGIQRLPLVPVAEAVVPGGAAAAENGNTPLERYFELAPDARLERPLASGRVRYLVGGYDTMAARNRNGVYGLELNIQQGDAQRLAFRRDLAMITRADLARSGRVYHTGRTVIGREYVYFLYDTGAGAKRNRDLARSFQHSTGSAIDVRLRDASGNTAVFRGALPAFVEQSDSDGRPLAAVAFQPVGPGGATDLRRSGADGELRVRFGPRSLHGPGLAALRRPAKLTPAAATEVRQPELADGESQPGNARDTPAVYEQHGPIFELRGRDLFYRVGARVDASFAVPDAHAEQVALYYFNETIDRWLLMAYPYRRANGRAYYRFTFRFEGVLAQLRDLSPPRILQPSLWAPPTLFSESKREIVREYLVADRGSGFSTRATQVLIDGRPVQSFAWIPDRAVLQLRLPADFPGTHGAVIAIRAGDHAGNASGWFFDYLEPRR